jgi:uncharacterized protein (UPF0332 family)
MKLLTVIREIVHRIESKAKLPLAIWDAVELIVKQRQGPTMSIAQYNTQFKSIMSDLQTQGGDISSHPGVVKLVAEQMYASGSMTSKYRQRSYNHNDAAREMSNAVQ